MKSKSIHWLTLGILVGMVMGWGISTIWYTGIGKPEPIERVIIKEVPTLKVIRQEVPVIITTPAVTIEYPPQTIEKIVYRNLTYRPWESVEQFTEWYWSQKFTVLFPSSSYEVDCDDYALRLSEQALKQGYLVSLALLDNQGKLFGVWVADTPNHMGNLIVIQNEVYYVEPQIIDFKIVKITDLDDTYQ